METEDLWIWLDHFLETGGDPIVGNFLSSLLLKEDMALFNHLKTLIEEGHILRGSRPFGITVTKKKP